MDDYEFIKRIGELLHADRRDGKLAPLAEYQRRYPGHDEMIAREYAAAAETLTSGQIDLVWLTAKHSHRYATLGEIARGGMGAIFHIRDETLRRDLAMKVVLGEGGKIDSTAAGSHGQLARRFLEEAQITARLDHPGVVPVHELGADEEGRLFFTMKLVKGRTLGEIFDSSRSDDDEWSLSRVLRVFIRVLETLAFAHDKGIVHRDLKPANVMVGDFGEVYVMDWGLARASDRADDTHLPDAEADPPPADQDARLTAAGQVLGTPAYMPQEQARGEKIDGRADVYAVGAMLYEFLTGAHPYGEPGGISAAHEVLLRLLREPPAPLSSTAPEAPAEIAAIASLAMAREPGDRYANAMDFAADLRNYTEGRVVAAHESGAWAELRKWVRRNRALAASLAAAIVLLVAGLVVSTSLGVRAAQERETARRNAYRAQIAAAVAELDNRDTHAVRVRLEQTPEDLRGWEYHHLMSRLDESLLVTDGISTALAPDGDGFLVLERSGRVYRWDPRTGRSRTIRAAGDADGFAWLSPSGTHLLTATRDPAIECRWTVRAEPLFSGGPALETTLDSANFEKLGEWELLGSSRYARATRIPEILYRADDGTVRMRSFETGDDRPVGVALDSIVAGSGAGSMFFASEAAAFIAVVAFPSRRTIFSAPRARDRAVQSAVWIPGTDRIFTGLSDHSTELLSAETGELVGWRRAIGHTGRVYAVAASADGILLASAGQDRVVRLLDADTGHVRRTYHGHERPVVDLAFSPDKQFLLSTGHDGKIRVWSALGDDPSVLRGHATYTYDVRFSPDGRRLYSAGWDAYVDSDGSIRAWDTDTGEPVAAFGGKDRCAFSIRVFPDGRRILTTGGERDQEWLGGDLCVWSSDTGALLRTYKGPFRRADLSPDGRLAAAADQDGKLTLLDLQTGRRVFESPGLEGGFFDVAPAFSPDGRLLASPVEGGSAFCIRDVETFRTIRTFRGHTAGVTALAFSPDGTRIVTSSHDHSFTLWDVQSGESLGVQAGHGDDVLAAAFDPEGARILTGGRDLGVRVWDADTLDEIVRLPGHQSYVIAVAVEPRSRAIASASGDATVRIWDTRTLREWHLARAERRALVTELSPRVRALFEAHEEPERVVEALRSEPEGRHRQVALQIALALAVERRTKE